MLKERKREGGGLSDPNIQTLSGEKGAANSDLTLPLIGRLKPGGDKEVACTIFLFVPLPVMELTSTLYFPFSFLVSPPPFF